MEGYNFRDWKNGRRGVKGVWREERKIGYVRPYIEAQEREKMGEGCDGS